MADGKVLEQAYEAVSALCAPDKMSNAEAVDFLNMLIDRLQSKIETLEPPDPGVRF